MNVYVCFECVSDGGDTTYARNVEHVFSNESDAILWFDQVPGGEYVWREYGVE